MKYLDAKFSSRPASREYRDGWERTFGRGRPVPVVPILMPPGYEEYAAQFLDAKPKKQRKR